jgi:transcription-repair coupling factor (superfamily II helicase)
VTIRSLISAAAQARSLQPTRELVASELFAPAKTQAIVLASMLRSSAKPLLVVAATGRQVDALASSLSELVEDLQIIEFPAWETLPHERLSPSPETVGKRVSALNRIAQLKKQHSSKPVVILMSIRAALQPLIAGILDYQPLHIQQGREYLLPELALKLIEFAYERVDLVTKRGEFSVRGGILDIFPTTADFAVRLEFFGDSVDEIRQFHVADQRSFQAADESVTIYPARELLITPAVAGKAREMAHEFPNLTEMLEKIANAIPVSGMESLAPVLASKLVPITDYVKTSVAVLLEPEKLAARAESLLKTNQEFLHAAWDVALSGAQAPIDLSAGGFLEFSEFTSLLRKDRDLIEVSSLMSEQSTDLGLKEIPSFAPGESIDWLADQVANNQAVVLLARGHGTAERIMEVAVAQKLPCSLTETVRDPKPGQITVAVGNLAHGFVLPDAKLVVLTEEEFFGVTASYLAPKERKIARRRGSQVDPLELKAGDYVVHEIHGVGRFKELVQRSNRAQAREYLLVEYAPPKRGYPPDTLFVPTDQLDLLSRYVGGEAPVLSKMGGVDWARAKSNARKAVRKIAIDLVKLYAARIKAQGFAFSTDSEWQRELEDAFPFQETPDQLTTIDEVKRDMEKPIPMDRLLAGDVGYGKTEVALRAAFKAIQDHKQVAMLVPTTLLVKQHFETFQSRFSGFPVNIAALSRFQTAAETKKVLEGLRSGSIDLVIGTHRLLSETIRYRDLGLLIIDEEQRFGVEHKEKIKALRQNVDVLAMSATPIPRTLEMAVTGIREMSTLATPPEDRHPILTYVGAYNDATVAAAIRRELIGEGQVFFVHNRVATIDSTAASLAKLVPEARIAVAHGQMPEQLLEQVVVDFWERKFDVLVSTTIIETGIDIPNANTLIVDRAENFGLSQLHQIRGRVGRSSERAYAYFFYDPVKPLGETAFDRLSTIATHNELGSGMQVAMKDLEIRGAGNFLGGEQSGQIAGVGFDLYMRMISEAVSEFRGVKVATPSELKLELPIDARIPNEYVDSDRLRLEAYHKLAAASGASGSAQQLAEIKAEIVDRFGPAPKPVLALLEVAALRQLANRLGLLEVNLLGALARIQPVELTDAELVLLSHEYPSLKYLKSSQLITVAIPKSENFETIRDQEVIDWVRNLLGKLQEIANGKTSQPDSNRPPT